MLPNTPLDGNDLNPLLQDPGLIIHPPLLYMGYVGLSVPFAFAIAALMGGRLDASWARWSRPWTNVAWGFLSLGIMLGSWWAYYELGWGGWWFWDPVENASFMPWLMGTALVHSLAATEKRGVFRSWTVLLAIFAFSLSLLGTFLVRSGVLTSVHAFAADPERGLFILIFLALVVGGSLLLYALRAPSVASRVNYSGVSRESLLMINNLVFTVSTIVVLLGTLFPLIMDAFSLGKYSVGPPYFNAVFVPLMALVMPFMAVGPLSRWREDTTRRWLHELLVPGLGVLVVAIVLAFLGSDDFNLWIALAVLLAGWVALGVVKDLWRRIATGLDGGLTWRRLTPSFLGMTLAHLGFAAVVLGAVVVTQENEERDLRMAVGDVETLGAYRFELMSLGQQAGPNYLADQAVFEVRRDQELIAVLVPEKRRYFASGQIMTEAAIDARLWRDLYIALGEPIGEQAWAVRLQYKPMVRWLWLGALMIGLGALVTAFDRRYRSQRSNVTAAHSLESQPLRAKRFIPLVAFAVLAGLLFRGLSIDPTELPAARLGQPFPDFAQPELTSGRQISVSALGRAARAGECVGDLVLLLSSRASVSVDPGRAGCPDLWPQLQRRAGQGQRVVGTIGRSLSAQRGPM